MKPTRPSRQDLEDAFAVTGLEPEIPDAVLDAYVAGHASDAEREIVETMMEVDPGVAAMVALLREERAVLDEPLKSPAPAPAKSAGRRPFWTVLATAGFAAACLILLIFVLADRRRLASQLSSSSLASAARSDELRGHIADLERRLSAAGADRNRLVADLDRTREELRRPASPSGGVEAVVANAIAHGLRVPSFIAGAAILRGLDEIPIRMTPDRTVVRLPVRLSWTAPDGRPVPGGNFLVQVTSEGRPVWSGRVSGSPAGVLGQLEPGQTYEWRVAQGSKLSRVGAFRVCTVAEEMRVQSMLKDKRYGPLERGVVFANIGLTTEAAEQFRLLSRTEPALGQKLLAELPKPSGKE